MFTPKVQLAGLQIQAVVGVWLLSGLARQVAAWIGMTLFSVLAGISLYLGWIGQLSCGCFGRIEISPWWTFSLDAACVAGLAITHIPRRSNWAVPPRGSIARFATGSLAFSTLLALETTPLAERQLARLRGESILLPEGSTDAGDARPNEYRRVPIVVQNLSEREVRIVGGTSNCSCVTTEELPVAIPGGGEAKIHIRVRFTGQPGEFKHRFDLYTDAPHQSQLIGHLTGRVLPVE